MQGDKVVVCCGIAKGDNAIGRIGDCAAFAAPDARMIQPDRGQPGHVVQKRARIVPLVRRIHLVRAEGAGDDGLDLVLKILRDAPLHLTEDGLLICEVGESEQHLIKLLPELPLMWIEFQVGQMGIFVVERHDLVTHSAKITRLAAEREGKTSAAVEATGSAGAGLF